jgi:hypothetical protein
MVHLNREGGRSALLLLPFAAIVCAFSIGAAQEIPRRAQAPGAAVAVQQFDSVRARREYVPEWYSMFTNIPKNWARFGNTVFTGEKVPMFVGMGLLTTALVATDDETWRMSDRWYRGSTTVADLSDFFQYMGDGTPQFGLAGAFAAYGIVGGDSRALRTGSQTVEAILSCGIVIQVLKHMTGRESPFVSSVPGGRWDLLPNQIEYHKHVPRFDAYPSGHIATALATVTVVAENYPELWWIRPIGYVITGAIGISMANTGIHWYSDYPLGLALGYTFGMLAAHPEEMGGLPGEYTPGHVKVSFSPVMTGDGAGVGVVVSF